MPRGGTLWHESREPDHVGLQRRRHADRTVLVLEVLEHRHQRAPDRESRAIQGVHGFGLAAVRIAPARVHAARLEGLAVAARGDLAITLLRRQPYFQIVGLDRKSTRLNSSHGYISYAVFCLKKKTHS